MFYTLLFYCCVPIILLRLLWRSGHAPAYRHRWLERFGILPPQLNNEKPKLWLHTVSVGETIAAEPLVLLLLQHYPDHQLLITTTTPTGSAQVRRLYADEMAKQRIVHVYIPYDLPGAIARFLLVVKPQLVLFMETEVWPNFLIACRQKKIPTALVNGRLSQRSLLRYQRFSWLINKPFSYFTTVAAQTNADAERMKMLGADKVGVTGSIKLELIISDCLQNKALEIKKVLSLNGRRKIIIAASTHDKEEHIIFSAYREILASSTNIPPLLILVPRHPERFSIAKKLCGEYSLIMACRSQFAELEEKVITDLHVLIGDTMGELMLLYGAADLSIVGGSFIEHGGHNMLEPAAWGLPILTGNSVYNFSLIANEMVEQNALLMVTSETLSKQLKELLECEEYCQRLGCNAKHYVEKNRGALRKKMALIEKAADNI